MAQAGFALARNEDHAIRIVEQLKAAGFFANDISVLFPDKTGTKDFAHEHHNPPSYFSPLLPACRVPHGQHSRH